MFNLYCSKQGTITLRTYLLCEEFSIVYKDVRASVFSFYFSYLSILQSLNVRKIDVSNKFPASSRQGNIWVKTNKLSQFWRLILIDDSIEGACFHGCSGWFII